jgi:hypothetical protein
MDRVQHFHPLVAHIVRAERNGGLHRGQRKQLEHVVLHHVAERTRAVVVPAAILDADSLGNGDLHVVHVPPVPDGLEDAVRKPERHQILDRLLPEVVIDAIDLMFGEIGPQLAVEVNRKG